GLGAHGVPQVDLHRGRRLLEGVDRAVGERDRLAAVAAVVTARLGGVGPAAFVTDATGRHQPGQSHEQRQESDRVAGAVAGHDAPWDQPFTAPAVRPRTMCRWNSTRTMTMGTAAMTAPATGMFDCSM